MDASGTPDANTILQHNGAGFSAISVSDLLQNPESILGTEGTVWIGQQWYN